MKKSPLLYTLIFSAWLALFAAAILPLTHELQRAAHTSWLIGFLVASSSAFIAYFWLNGTKDVVYTLFYYLNKGRLTQRPPLHFWKQRHGTEQVPFVVLVYCTANDFNAHSLLTCMQQKYKNFRVVILDDSSNPDHQQEVETFARRFKVPVIRREGNEGFKAGNLNNFLRRARFDYFVILDSDEIIPPDFITRSLDYFEYYPNAGIIQANHIASRNINTFMSLFSIGVNSHWITYQAVKHWHGFLSLLGHGAMVSRECYEAAGGFPPLVAEDLCFSIEARNKGYMTAFAGDITCEEEYPVDYLAFKKRHSKWTQGNMEFIKKYTRRILTSRMTLFEKLDIFLFTYNLPLTAFFAFYVVINVVILPLLHYRTEYPVWLLAPTGAFLIAPLLNDIIYYHRKKHPLHLVWYIFHSMLLYGSMLFISLRSSIKSMFNKSIFLVTPKNQQHISFGAALRANRGELFFAIAVLAVALICDKSPLPTLLIALPALSSVYLTLISNKTPLDPQEERYDERL
jgi:cellulose synthase/poly-beta-1,6-N-acetylglucosamine synthase-like glycosyltransferase